jgi:hypothetical protein
MNDTFNADNKDWQVNHTIPNIPSGLYTARFKATTLNNNSETVDVQYRVIKELSIFWLK